MLKILIGAVKWASAFAIVGALAWQAGSEPIRLGSEVVVHVGAGDVEVWIDELRFRIDRPWQRPIICQREPGVHELAMLKDGVEVYRETFVVEEGDDNVLTAWDESHLIESTPDSPAEVERTAFLSAGLESAPLAPEPPRRN